MTESSAIRSAIAKYQGRARALIPILQEIQDELRWLSPRTLEAVAAELSLPLAHVFSVATFYKSFSLKPRGRRTCTVCMGTACHVRGGAAILEHFERELGVPAGRTTAGRRIHPGTGQLPGRLRPGPAGRRRRPLLRPDGRNQSPDRPRPFEKVRHGPSHHRRPGPHPPRDARKAGPAARRPAGPHHRPLGDLRHRRGGPGRPRRRA